MNPAITQNAPRLWRLAQFGFTFALVALLWAAADGPKIMDTVAHAQIGWVTVAIVALICQTILSAYRWKVTAHELGQRLSAAHAIREYFLSQVINQALPGAILGDASRAVRGRADAGLAVSALAVALERFAGQIFMFATMTMGFIATFAVKGGLDWPTQFAAPVGLMIIVTLLAALSVALFRRNVAGLSPRISHWIGLAGRALLSRAVLPRQFSLGLGILLCNISAFGFCVWAVGAQISVSALLAIVPIILFSMLIPLTISGWGVREGSAAVLLPLAGVPVSTAIAASVLFGITMVLAASPGLFIMVRK